MRHGLPPSPPPRSLSRVALVRRPDCEGRRARDAGDAGVPLHVRHLRLLGRRFLRVGLPSRRSLARRRCERGGGQR